jgi:hypothetical protein
MNRRAVGKIDFPIKDDEDAEDRCTESTLRSGLFAYRGFIGHLDDPAADLEIGAEKPAIYADLTDVASGYLRDLAVARDGNAYVRSFDADASGPDGFASARVLLATPDGTIRSVADNIAHPNGLAITSSHDLLLTETLGNRLLAFKIDGDGALRHRKVFANFEGMNPLGICEDAEGRLGGRCPTVAFCPCATRRACQTSRSRTGPSCGRVSTGRTRRLNAFLPDSSLRKPARISVLGWFGQKASIIFTYGRRLSPDAELWLWKISPSR